LTNEVRLSSRAWRDLERLADFLAGKSPTAADRAKRAIWAAIRSLDQHADRGAPAGSPDIRRLIAPFGRTGYVVIYHFEPGSVTVLRIFHAREDR
jgi:plasmid stabilization system protein ParE